ncbi:MAG: hypothetical protein WCP57_10725 [Bacteroidota bacterium]
MKITAQNRSLIFLLGTIVLGILIISVLMLGGSDGVPPPIINKDLADPNYKALETKIDALKKQHFNPDMYSTILTEIDGSYQQELITGSAKSFLLMKLTNEYSDLVYKQAELFLMHDVGKSNEINGWLSQLEKINGGNPKINIYRNQIKWYNYYASTLPTKVETFIESGISKYQKSTYESLKKELQDMPQFEPKYKNRSKFNKIKEVSINKLAKFDAAYATRP